MFKRIFRFFVALLVLPILYIALALLIGLIPVNKVSQLNKSKQQVYLTTNGVHLYIILEKGSITSPLFEGLDYEHSYNYYSFGWGDRNFYLNTPDWSDLTVKNAANALLLNSPSLMHFSQYDTRRRKWIAIPVSEEQLEKLNEYILQSFKVNKAGEKIILPFEGYTNRDSFYEANGNYNCFNTSNTWVNEGFKKSGLKACLWTPFDFVLIEKYKE